MPKRALDKLPVSINPAKHPRYNYRLLWREGSKRRSVFTRTKAEAEAKAREIATRLAAEGSGHDPMTEGERRGVQRWRELAHRHGIPADVTL